jgi:O-6-methylguanine DNA methyltransferase
MNDSFHGTLDSQRTLLHQLRSLQRVEVPDTIRTGVMAELGLADSYFELDSPLGPLFVAHNSRGISAVMRAEEPSLFEQLFQERHGRPVHRTEAPGALAEALAEHLWKRRRRDLQFDLRSVSDFERAVLLKALEIPRGEVRPYAWIAREIGRPKAVRAVGSALARNPVAPFIPCHRVVRLDGRIGNYGYGSDNKRAILRLEGVEPDELERLAAQRIRFVGASSTHIYCFPTCRQARRISEQRRVPFASPQEAEAAGFRPCQVCRPAALRTA